jgi:Flp pilus assembly protein TadB
VGERSAAVLAVVAAALWAWPTTAGTVRRRVRRVSRAGGQPRSRPALAGRRPVNPATRRWVLAVAAGAAVVLVLGGTWGPVLGAAAAVAVERLLRRRGTSSADDGDRLVRALPLACDLLAVCLEAGLPSGAALAAVADASPDPLGGALSRVAGLYRLGAEPARAWAEASPSLAGLARAFVRAGGSGSSMTAALRALSAELRASSRAGTEAAVRRAGVWVLAPLGACFLPAFLCLGVVPLVLGIAHGVFG